MTILVWYFFVFLIGIISLPFSARIFRSYEGFGYSFSKTLGLVTLGLGHWYLVSFGLNINTASGATASLFILIAASLIFAKTRHGLAVFNHWRKWIVPEIIFAIAFGFMLLIRSLNPEISGTEKPMELAFINAIRNSTVFPPNDPWMSGYSISYYYFGYLLTATLSLLSGIEGSIAFNLMIATVFGLVSVSAYTIVSKIARSFGWLGWKKSLLSLLAPIYILIVSNAEGALEMLHALGVGWKNGGVFWRWLDIKDLTSVPAQPYGWDPRFWFWWRASRVVSDVDLIGDRIEVIDEFPFFSFLLGDLHPHVLAIPIVLLLIGMGVEFFDRVIQTEGKLDVDLKDHRSFLWLFGGLLGVLGLTNTWDLPIYFGLMTLMILYLTWRSGPFSDAALWKLFITIFGMGLFAILPFLPFYAAFSSQAGGILPNILFPTNTGQLWVMFFPLFLPTFLYLIAVCIEKKASWVKGHLISIGLVVGLLLFSTLLGVLLDSADGLNLYGAADLSSFLKEGLIRRSIEFGGAITLIVLLGLPLGILFREREASEVDFDDFAAILTVLAALLIIAPEFVYLRDQFGTRMNTIFKFYYQAWILLALVSAIGVARISAKNKKIFLFAGVPLVFFGLFVGLLYPILSLPQKLDLGRDGKFSEMTLDGASMIERYNPDVRAAMRWLADQPENVIAEAVGGSYTEYARMATFSGQSTVLGWPGHESQWRGSYDLIPEREADVRTLYETDQWSTVAMILERYDIGYVILSDLERATYQVRDEKFDDNLPIIWESGSVRIYQAKADPDEY